MSGLARMAAVVLFIAGTAAPVWPQGTAAQNIKSLMNILQRSPDHKQRREAAKMLGNMGAAEAVPALINALRADSNDGVREETAKALGAIGDRRAVQPLLRALNDKDGGVRRDSARSLGRLGDHAAIRPLLQAMVNTEDPWMVDACAGSLKNLDFLNRITVNEK